MDDWAVRGGGESNYFSIPPAIGDGNQDLAPTVRGRNWITLYFGNGSGGFFRQMRVPTGIGEFTPRCNIWARWTMKAGAMVLN